MQACIESKVGKVFDIMYKEPDKGGIVFGFWLTLPAGSTLRGSCAAVSALVNGTGSSYLEMLPKVERPNHKALL